MAVETKKSTIITGAESTPRDVSGAHINGGRLVEKIGYFTNAAADDDNSTFQLCRVPSNARISDIQAKTAGVTGMTDVNIGFYQTSENGGAIVGSGNQIGDAIDFSSALDWANISEVAVTDLEKRVYELLSLTEDPGIDYDLVLTVITQGSGTNPVAVRVRYVV